MVLHRMFQPLERGCIRSCHSRPQELRKLQSLPEQVKYSQLLSEPPLGDESDDESGDESGDESDDESGDESDDESADEAEPESLDESPPEPFW